MVMIAYMMLKNINSIKGREHKPQAKGCIVWQGSKKYH